MFEVKGCMGEPTAEEAEALSVFVSELSKKKNVKIVRGAR